jgi:catechol-2,3-dioxygenase
VRLALRLDPVRAAALAGFDVIALEVPERDDVEAWRARLDESGQPHGGLVTGHRGGSVLVGLHDPDGIEIRLYADGPEQ